MFFKNIGYKSCYVFSHGGRTRLVIVKLEILGKNNESRNIIKKGFLSNKKRENFEYSKYRCEKARVLDIYDPFSGKKYTQANSEYDPTFTYDLGKIVVPKADSRRFSHQFSFVIDDIICGPGIHYFKTIEAAIGYGMVNIGNEKRNHDRLARNHWTGKIIYHFHPSEQVSFSKTYQDGHKVHKSTIGIIH